MEIEKKPTDANTFILLSYMQWPYEAAAIAFEAIPRTLAQNCGVNVIRTMTALQGKVETLLFEVDMQYSLICVHLNSFHLFIYSMQMARMHG